MEKEGVGEYILVGGGVGVMVGYHIYLLYHFLKHPTSTVVGLNAITRRFWVASMMEDVTKNGVLAVQSLRNNIMASTLLASMAIMLSSLMAVLMTNRSSSSSSQIEVGFSLKSLSIISCFLVAFLMNVQSVRYYSHATILINVPFKKMMSTNTHHHLHDLQSVEFVGRSVNKGSYFWTLGLRAFYFSFPLFLWVFGPIPMFICCILLTFMLYFLDFNFDLPWVSHDQHHCAPAPPTTGAFTNVV